ncbi:hypothetical protein L2X99_06965 [Microbacterium sp. KUDC0406]|uniref:hypothetical protein n=1 Tax=Microbacterium sp. KUDC0406 TaxID=2909588 RepID=UPI001F1A3E8B|nr:hypothetical protein [Microbacterium sp. KUDC0406]UJP11266.1 hypothetical protein L2X99_06965 [Microbacterium sp. KUDC0406]
MAEFIAFIIMFLGGIYLLGISFGLEAFQGVVFIAGILIISLALAFLMRQRGSATRRSNNWSQDS